MTAPRATSPVSPATLRAIWPGVGHLLADERGRGEQTENGGAGHGHVGGPPRRPGDRRGPIQVVIGAGEAGRDGGRGGQRDEQRDQYPTLRVVDRQAERPQGHRADPAPPPPSAGTARERRYSANGFTARCSGR